MLDPIALLPTLPPIPSSLNVVRLVKVSKAKLVVKALLPKPKAVLYNCDFTIPGI